MENKIFTGMRIARWCCQIMWHPKIFFCYKTLEFAKVFSLEIFPAIRYMVSVLSCRSLKLGLIRYLTWWSVGLSLSFGRSQVTNTVPHPSLKKVIHIWVLCPRPSHVRVCCKIYIACCIYAGEETQAAFRKHFEEQLGLYQHQVIT